MITFTEYDGGLFRGVYENGVYFVDLIQDVDGFYYCWFDTVGGYHPAYLLRQIADTLDELNEPWEKQIEEDFAHA